MKSLILGALAAMSLGIGVASAQGLPAGTSPPNYAAGWAQQKLAQDPNSFASLHNRLMASRGADQTAKVATNTVHGS